VIIPEFMNYFKFVQSDNPNYIDEVRTIVLRDITHDMWLDYQDAAKCLNVLKRLFLVFSVISAVYIAHQNPGESGYLPSVASDLREILQLLAPVWLVGTIPIHMTTPDPLPLRKMVDDVYSILFPGEAKELYSVVSEICSISTPE
jgi:hypothetical protein